MTKEEDAAFDARPLFIDLRCSGRSSDRGTVNPEPGDDGKYGIEGFRTLLGILERSFGVMRQRLK
jgi:hypothetical protein